MIFREAGVAVDIVRRVGFERREEKEERKAVERASVSASKPTRTVITFVVVEYEVSGVDEARCWLNAFDVEVVSVITKRRFQLMRRLCLFLYSRLVSPDFSCCIMAMLRFLSACYMGISN